MIPVTTCEQNLDDLGMFVRTNGVLLDLSTDYTFSLKVGEDATGFTTTVGFTGAVGVGTPPDGIPNLVKQWALTGELLTITPDLYEAELRITRQFDGRFRVRQFWIRVVPPL